MEKKYNALEESATQRTQVLIYRPTALLDGENYVVEARRGKIQGGYKLCGEEFRITLEEGIQEAILALKPGAADYLKKILEREVPQDENEDIAYDLLLDRIPADNQLSVIFPKELEERIRSRDRIEKGKIEGKRRIY